jgi:uncharacterized membrane protein YhaH (DUF805 family)
MNDPASQGRGRGAGRSRFWLMIVLALVILVPALVGFGYKFYEFLMLAGDDQNSFAVMPVLNYLLSSLGFLLLFGWAVLHGMFRDIERPKITMLENEQRLDAEEAEAAEGGPYTREWER